MMGRRVIDSQGTDSTGISSESEDFFNAHLCLFREAARSAGGINDFYYTIGKFTILLRFAGSALVSAMTPAFEHLQINTGKTPDLTVMLYDSVSTRTELPSFSWLTDDYTSPDETQWFNGRQRRTVYYLSSGILNILDFQTNQAIFWIKDFSAVPYHESGSPLRAILSWWMRKEGCQFVHAAAVGTEKGGVLLVGKGGSGKSTAALACLNDEKMSYVGDDYVLITDDAEPKVYSIYSSAKLDASHAENFPELLRLASNKKRLHEEKALVFLHKYFPEKIAKGFRVYAILAPHVSGSKRTTYHKTTPSHILRALAPSTIFQIPGDGADTFKCLGNFVKNIPCYQLESGTEISEISKSIMEVLSESMQ